MGKLGEVLAHPEEILPLVRENAFVMLPARSERSPRAGALQVRIAWATKQAQKLPSDPKLAFCYDMLNTVSRR